ncbi:S-adenosyl-L-methionine-dependent methyltransferase [Polyplosphaeria fusca]|uniref:S-adenosyl-L-methionine-dependent methyltransferase n=1 Tax=Polyplosphaeria fusca TaxID=682080 RepID=A0A9P4QSX5_9PLEO|nr:S-adenosyl-L-methionine-dependent methyltransferase [Polyplosphaeria fusca]
MAPKKPDWSATQYLKFSSQRTRPVHDLLAQCLPHLSSPSPRIYDLGCGPGNSTSALLSAFPSASITGIDRSPDMLSRARSDPALSGVAFEEGDLGSWRVPKGEGVGLVFSNAAMHWLRSSVRVAVVRGLLEGLGRGGVFAMQVPDNYGQASHVAMRRVARMEGRAWSAAFEGAGVGEVGVETRPDLDPVEGPRVWFEALGGLGDVDVWRTEYQHVLGGVGEIVEWVKGSGLQPYLERMEGDEGARRAFLEEYERVLGEVYEVGEGGRVVLGYMRLFIVAVRK